VILLEFIVLINSFPSQFELPRGCRSQSHTTELGEIEGVFWPKNLGEISLRLDQHLWRISGLEVVAFERAKLTILGPAQ